MAPINLLYELPPDKQKEFSNEPIKELEKEFRLRIQPPIERTVFLNHLVSLAGKYLETNPESTPVTILQNAFMMKRSMEKEQE